MARLVSMPVGVRYRMLDIIDDPNTRNSGAQTSQDGSEQTCDGIGQVWSLRLALSIARGAMARRVRGSLDALLGGANAIRINLSDADMMTPAESGMPVAATVPWEGLPSQPWGNGLPWDNGLNWQASYPTVRVAASADADATLVSLQDEFWGHRLDVGDRFGFFPFHFGMYEVIQVVSPGTYRVKYKLRKAIAYSATASLCDRATLFPTIVVRPNSKAAAKAPVRGVAFAEETVITLSEVIDPYVRQYFTD